MLYEIDFGWFYKPLQNLILNIPYSIQNFPQYFTWQIITLSYPMITQNVKKDY